MALLEIASTISYEDTEGSVFFPSVFMSQVPNPTYDQRIEPESVTVTSEYPALRSEYNNRMSIKSLGYQRYSFEVQYAPMTKEEAHELMALFERYMGAAKWFYFPIPWVAANTLGNKLKLYYGDANTYPVQYTVNQVTGETTGKKGDETVVIPEYDTYTLPGFIEPGLLFKFDNHDKIYKITERADREVDGRMLLKISPPLLVDVDEANFVIREEHDNYSGDHIFVRVRLDEEEFEYGANGSGLVVVKYKLIEDL